MKSLRNLKIFMLAAILLFTKDNTVVYANEYKDTYNLGTLKLDYSKNDYQYDTYIDGQDKFNFTWNMKLNTGDYRNLRKSTSSLGSQYNIGWDIDVKHSYTPHYYMGDISNYGDTKKTWIYNTSRTLRLTNRNDSADATTKLNKYISNIKFEAQSIETGEYVTSPELNLIDYKALGIYAYFTFPEGYIYHVTLPESLIYGEGIAGSNSSTITQLSYGITYHFIVGDIDKVKKLNIPEYININAVNKRLQGEDTDNDHIFDTYVDCWDIVSSLNLETLKNSYNYAKYT